MHKLATTSFTSKVPHNIHTTTRHSFSEKQSFQQSRFFNSSIKNYKVITSEQKEKTHVQKSLDDFKNSKNCMVSKCVDSRVSGSTRGKDKGTYTFRTASAFIPPYKEDSECGVQANILLLLNKMKVDTLYVIGHSDCAGVRESLEGTKFNWLSNHNTTLHDKFRRYAKQHGNTGVLNDALAKKLNFQSYQNLLTYPGVQERVKTGGLSIYNCFQQLPSAKYPKGAVEVYNPKNGKYELVPDAEQPDIHNAIDEYSEHHQRGK